MMDLTPLEVRKKKGDFRRQIRGYDPESVDDFLDLVADRLEALVRENAALTETSSALEQRVSEYREREKALTEALVSAQQLREQMRQAAAKEAEEARSEAARDASEQRSLAAQEAEQARREARALLDQAKAEAAHTIETAQRAATAELERIRGELARIRDREVELIRTLQAKRTELLETYGGLLGGQMQALASLRAAVSDVDLPEWEEERVEERVQAEFAAAVEPVEAVAPEVPPVEVAAFDAEAELLAEVEGPADAGQVEVEVSDAQPESGQAEGDEAAGFEADLPPLSPDLAALIEAAETEVDQAWSEAPFGDEDPGMPGLDQPAAAEEPVGAAASGDVDGSPAAGELVLEDVEPAVMVDPALDGLESDEDFIDTLIAQAGVRPTQNGRPPVAPPSFLEEEPEPDMAAAAEPEAEAPELLVLDEDEAFAATAGAAEVPAAAPEVPVAAEDGLDDPFVMLDEDESFDALFGDGEEDPAEFDFDAALASATGLSGYPADPGEPENPFKLGVQPDDPHATAELLPGASAFTLSNGMPAPANGFSPARPGELTLRPLSAEEDAPDLPSEPREREEMDDDMFSTMFRGRE